MVPGKIEGNISKESHTLRVLAVSGVVATYSVMDQGTNWVQRTLPPASSVGTTDIVIQSTSIGDTTLTSTSSNNSAGVISAPNSMMEYRISFCGNENTSYDVRNNLFYAANICPDDDAGGGLW